MNEIDDRGVRTVKRPQIGFSQIGRLLKLQPGKNVKNRSPRWLSLFLIMAICAVTTSTTIFIGDKRLELAAERAEAFTAVWNSWRLTEDSIRTAVDHIGSLLVQESPEARKSNHKTDINHSIERIRRTLRQLQSFRLPPNSLPEVGPIYKSLATLIVASDSVEISALALIKVHGAADSPEHAAAHARWQARQLDFMQALNAIRNERMRIVDRYNDQFKADHQSWRNAKTAINTVAFTTIILLAVGGTLIARRLRRIERDQNQRMERLKESEERFRGVLANIPGVIFRSRVAEDWPVEYISDKIEFLTGYPAEDFVENRVRRFGSIIHPADHDRVTDAAIASVEGGMPYTIEYRIINAHGDVVWVSERGQSGQSLDGKVKWIDGAMFNITDRKKAVDDLAKSEETLRALIDANPGIAVLLDAEGHVLTVNEALARRLGSNRQNLVGMMAYEIVPKAVSHLSWQNYRKVVETGERCDFVVSSEDRYTHIFMRPITDGRGRVVRVAVFGLDISEWKRALHESERLKYLLDQTSDIVGIVNKDYGFVYMNRACRDFITRAGEPTPKELDVSLYYSDDSLAMIKKIAFPAAVRDGIWSGEGTLVASDGSEVPSSLVFIAHRSEAGEFQYLSCIIRDLTDRVNIEKQLAESNNLLHEMLNAIPLPVYYKDLDLKYLGCNTAFERLCGLTEVQLVGKTINEAFPFLDHDKVISLDSATLMSQVEEVVETTFKSHDNGIRDIVLHKAPLRTIDGTNAGIVAVSIDITERKRMEQALVSSERQLRQLTAGLPGVVYQCCLGPGTQIAFPFISASAQSVFGYSPGEVMYNPEIIFTIIHPDDIPLVQSSMAEAREVNTPWDCEFRCVIRGEVRWIKGSALLQSRVGDVSVWNGMLVDITAQRLAEQQLRVSDERFRKIFEMAGFGIASVDLYGQIIESNPAFQRMVQYSGEELRSLNFADITHPDDLAAELQKFQDGVSRGGNAFSQFDKRYVRKDGQIIWARLSVVEFLDEAGELQYYIGLIEDITERRQADEKIRESELLYRTLFESSSEGLFLMKDKFVDCNERVMEIWGCQREQIIGKSPAAFSPENQPDGRNSMTAALEYIDKALAGEPQSFYWRHRRSDGSEIDTDIALKRLSIAGENLVLASMRDISERIRIESALRDSLLQLNTLVQSAVDGIVLISGDGTIETVNPAAEKIFDTDEVSLRGRNAMELVAEPHRTRYLELLHHPDSEHAASLLRGVHEVLGLRAGDYIFPMDIAISPLRLGEHFKYVAIVRDITERKTSEQRIVENEARLEAILSSAGDGIIVVGNDRAIQIFNDAAATIFGQPATVLIGRPIQEIIPGFAAQQLPSRGERLSFETVGDHPEHGEFPLLLSISRVSFGGTDSYALIARDLTESFNRRDRMMEADKLTSIGTLAAGIAHEFKNYLAGIIGNASFALDGLQDPDGLENARDAFEQIILIGDRANEIALSLLTYSRKRQDDLELLDMRELIQSTLRFTGKELAEKNIEVVTRFDDVPKVLVSVNRAQQVILNLIINASQAIVEGGVISVSTSRIGNMVSVKIGDTGMGIAPDNMRRIFDPFFSTKGVWGKDAVHGTGLGLSICKNIINSFGGEIVVESVVGKGTTFTFTLPVPEDEVVSRHLARMAESSK